MQRSPSLTKAISTAEALLRADTDDLRQLAAIAGQDPVAMYLGADLTGVDLRSQDISFLVGLGTNFEGAILTDEQRRRLRRGSAKERQQETRRTIRDLRVDMILRFIERHMDADMVRYQSGGGLPNVPHDLDSNASLQALLQEVLLDPILKSTSTNPNDQFGSDYMSAALSQLSKYLSDGSESFFEELFQLFGDVRCPIDDAVIHTLKHHYRPQLGARLGKLVARMRPTRVLDAWWILDQNGFAAMIAAATELSNHREVHAAAVESFATEVVDPKLSLKMLTETRYELDADQAERIAYAITSRNWPASMTTDVLDAKVPRSLAVAIFRQLLAQGNGSRVSEVLRWLDRSMGGVGALSLESAIASIDDFEVVLKLAKMLGHSRRGNQMRVFTSRLSELVRTDSERSNLNRFRQEHI
ncbi:hypothetical protein E3U26_12515 [Paracoccus ferrooxidans]|nr:hypothetical protein E3U26_12515 [Paracoccus ferrooxidans]